MDRQEYDRFVSLCQAVEAALTRNTYIFQNVGIAVSGGADSVALFHAARLVQQKLHCRLYAIHVEHGLRGEESLQDARFVQELCACSSIPLHLEHISGLDLRQPGIESLARRARYQVYQNAWKRFHLDCILLAQHGEDQAESVLMNLCRGAGLNGLSGIKARNKVADMLLIRPFLQLSRQTLREALQSAGLAYREDSSNAEAIYARNILRLRVMPVLKELFPGVERAVGRLTEQAAGDLAYFDRIVREQLQAHAVTAFPFCCMPLQPLRTMDRAIALRVLRSMYQLQKARLPQSELLADEEYGLSYDRSLAVYHMLHDEGCSKIELHKAIFATKSKYYLHFSFDFNMIDRRAIAGFSVYEERSAQHVLQSGGAFAGLRIAIASAPKQSNGRNLQSVPDALLRQAVFRTRRTGDRIRPFGMQGSQPLKKYLIERQVDREFRDYLPLLAVGSNILWVCGVGASEDVRRDGENTFLEIRGTMPWSLKNDIILGGNRDGKDSGNVPGY